MKKFAGEASKVGHIVRELHMHPLLALHNFSLGHLQTRPEAMESIPKGPVEQGSGPSQTSKCRPTMTPRVYLRYIECDHGGKNKVLDASLRFKVIQPRRPTASTRCPSGPCIAELSAQPSKIVGELESSVDSRISGNGGPIRVRTFVSLWLKH